MPDETDHAPDDDVLLIVRFDEIHEPAKTGNVEIAELTARRDRDLEDPNPGTSGFSRLGAVSALEALERESIAVESVEVMRSMCDQPLYAVQHWRCERGANEPHAVFCTRSIGLAEEFLLSYADPGDGSLTYVFHTSPAQTLGSARNI